MHKRYSISCCVYVCLQFFILFAWKPFTLTHLWSFSCTYEIENIFEFTLCVDFIYVSDIYHQGKPNTWPLRSIVYSFCFHRLFTQKCIGNWRVREKQNITTQISTRMKKKKYKLISEWDTNTPEGQRFVYVPESNSSLDSSLRIIKSAGNNITECL